MIHVLDSLRIYPLEEDSPISCAGLHHSPTFSSVLHHRPEFTSIIRCPPPDFSGLRSPLSAQFSSSLHCPLPPPASSHPPLFSSFLFCPPCSSSVLPHPPWSSAVLHGPRRFPTVHRCLPLFSIVVRCFFPFHPPGRLLLSATGRYLRSGGLSSCLMPAGLEIQGYGYTACCRPVLSLSQAA